MADAHDEGCLGDRPPDFIQEFAVYPLGALASFEGFLGRVLEGAPAELLWPLHVSFPYSLFHGDANVHVRGHDGHGMQRPHHPCRPTLWESSNEKV